MNPLKRHIRRWLAKTNIINPFNKPFNNIEFETTNYCNRKCVYCPNSKYDRTALFGNKFMSQEIFDKLVSDLKEMDFKGIISPHLYGEPLTDKRLPRWTAALKQSLPHSIIRIVTNADFLDDNIYTELINCGVDIFNISKHGNTLSQGFLNLYNGLSIKEQKKRFIIIDYYENYNQSQNLFFNRGGEIPLKKPKRHPSCCIYVTYPVLNSNGDVILCCNDYQNSHICGNILERSLTEIWQDKKNINLRRRIFKGYFDLPICKNCWESLD
ncbi:MAG: SPASM domain-containing protein [Nitrospirae bacterium]|nr:SPASM domain-containing protein [Nitrospirota bacterium]